MDLLGAWPVAIILASAVLRILEDEVRDSLPSDPDDRLLARRDRFLAELLATSAQAGVIAGGVGAALLFGSRLGLVL